MVIGDSGEFTRRLTALAEYFDTELSAARQAIYFEAMRDLPFESCAAAISAAICRCKFFPRASELRELVHGNPEDRAEMAWLLFRKAMTVAGAYRSLLVEDGALAETVVAMFGTWPSACAAEFSPEMWTAKRKEFGRIYAALSDRHLAPGRRLAGICEQQNGLRADWQKYTEVMAIGDTEVRVLTAAEMEALAPAPPIALPAAVAAPVSVEALVAKAVKPMTRKKPGA